MVAAVTVGTIAAYHGLYTGYKAGKSGKEQYDALKVRADDLQGKIDIAEAVAKAKAAPAL